MAYLNNSSWRKTSVTLNSGLNEVSFNDTKPNVFYVVNTSNTYLYFGATNIPTAKSYEWRVKPNTSDAFGKPLPTGKLYIVNPTDDVVTLEVYSDVQAFDIDLLKNLNANMDDEQIDRLKFDGIVRGWDALESVKTKIVELPQEFVTSLKADIVANNMSDKIDALEVVLDDILDTVQSLKGIDTTTEVKMGDMTFTDGVASVTFDSPVIDLITLSNDTDKDVVVTMSRDTNSQSFTLKSGEVIDNISGINIMSIAGNTDSDVNGNMRYIVKKGVA